MGIIQSDLTDAIGGFFMGSIYCYDTDFRVNFISLKGQIQVLAFETEEITRAGADGHAYRNVGLRGEKFEMIGIADYLTFDDAIVFYEEMMNMQGHLVEVTDDYDEPAGQITMLKAKKTSLRP